MRQIVAGIALLLAVTAYADNHPTVGQLGWMTGSWDGPTGPNTLEENWTLPRSGTISSLVRSTGPSGTQMVEIVHIEEANGTLDLYIQQWNVPFDPRSPAQKMTMREMTDNSITFDAVTEGGIKTLKYSRPADKEFHVDVTVANDQNFVIKLAARE